MTVVCSASLPVRREAKGIGLKDMDTDKGARFKNEEMVENTRSLIVTGFASGTPQEYRIAVTTGPSRTGLLLNPILVASLVKQLGILHGSQR